MHVIFDETNSLKIREEELDVDAKILEKKMKDILLEDTPSQEKEDRARSWRSVATISRWSRYIQLTKEMKVWS